MDFYELKEDFNSEFVNEVRMSKQTGGNVGLEVSRGHSDDWSAWGLETVLISKKNELMVHKKLFSKPSVLELTDPFGNKTELNSIFFNLRHILTH